MTEQERFNDHERRIKRLERDVEVGRSQHAIKIGDHEHRIDALERRGRDDLWTSVAIGGYQQALTQVQEGLREVRAELEGVKAREVLGLDAEAKFVLIEELNAVIAKVDAIEAQFIAERQKRIDERVTNLERIVGEEPSE